MKAFVAITRSTIDQVLGIRKSIIFTVAALAPALVFLLTTQALADEAALNRFLAMVVAMYFPLLVPIVSLIISASALGDERRDGTLSFLVLRPIPRSAIAGAKFLGAALAVAAINTIGAGALGFVYGLETGSWGVVLPLIAGGIVAGTVYTSIFVPLGFFTDRAVLAGLAFVLVFENGVVSALGGLSILSPWRLGMSTFADIAPADVSEGLRDFGVTNLSGLGSTLARTVVIVALSIAAITLVLRRRDLA